MPNCDQCKQEYEPYHKAQRFCSSKCRNDWNNNQKKERIVKSEARFKRVEKSLKELMATVETVIKEWELG